MSDLKFVSLADSAFESLENDILSGVYEKGDILTEISLSEKLGISRTPIREAVRRLEQEKLVKLLPKGIEIIGLTKEDIDDIYAVRIMLEGEATARFAERADDDDLKTLSDIVDLQEFYTKKNKAEDINQTDSKFHDYIYKNCGSDVFSSILSSLHRKVQKYRKISIQDSDRAISAVEEHKKIYEAIANHDKELSKKLVSEHITNAHNSIVNNLKK